MEEKCRLIQKDMVQQLRNSSVNWSSQNPSKLLSIPLQLHWNLEGINLNILILVVNENSFYPFMQSSLYLLSMFKYPPNRQSPKEQAVLNIIEYAWCDSYFSIKWPVLYLHIHAALDSKVKGIILSSVDSNGPPLWWMSLVCSFCWGMWNY